MRPGLCRIAILAACSVAPACIAGIPPARVELGGVAGPDLGGRQQLAALASSASASYTRSERLDLSGGYLLSTRGERAQHGSAIELGARVWVHRDVQLWASGRGEVWWNRTEPGDERTAGKARLLLEIGDGVSGSVSDSDGGALVHGNFAIGLYVEGGVVSVEDGPLAPVVGIGLAVRLPLVLAVTSLEGAYL